MLFLLILIVIAYVVAMLIYPWLAIALLLVAPVLKVAAVYYLPMFRVADPTVVACAVAGVMAIWVYIRRVPGSATIHIPWTQLVCMVVLAAILTVSLFWTTAPQYGSRKALRFLGIGIPYLLLPTFFVRCREDGHRMLKMIILVGLAVSAAMIMMPRSQLSSLQHGSNYSRGTFLGSDAVMPAVIMAVGMLVLSSMFVVPGSASPLMRYSALVVFPVGLLGMLLTGSRSTLLGLGLAAMALPLLAGKKGRFKASFIVFVLLPLSVFMLLTGSVATGLMPMGRWDSFFGGGISENLDSRFPHYSFCLTNWVSSPILGHGSGSFAMDLFMVDDPMWPHNILLEALYETGLVGFIALTLFLWSAFREGIRGLRLAETASDRLLVVGPMVAFVFMLVQALSHWDLDGGRSFYLFAGLLHVCVLQAQDGSLPSCGYRLEGLAEYGIPSSAGAAWAPAQVGGRRT